MLEFFGLGSFSNGSFHYLREAEGAWSWQHLLASAFYIVVMIGLAVFFGKRNKNKSLKEKNMVLIASAFLINGFEIVKIVVLCIRCQDPMHWLYVLPLFLCSIQLIAIPMAAFCRGRVKEAGLDFVMVFGILGAVFGIVGASQNYSVYPVVSMDNVFSGVTHAISGFASLYIAISGMTSMKMKNLYITMSILLGFSAAAYIANIILDYNYMFLMSHDGTPYSIFYNLVGGSPILYPLVVVLLFVIYVIIFYYAVKFIRERRDKYISCEKKQVTVLRG